MARFYTVFAGVQLWERYFLDAYNFAKRLKTLHGLSIRSHLQSMDRKPRPLRTRSNPPNFGIEHLVRTATSVPSRNSTRP